MSASLQSPLRADRAALAAVGSRVFERSCLRANRAAGHRDSARLGGGRHCQG